MCICGKIYLCPCMCMPYDVRYNTHTHPFNGRFSGTTQVSRYQKGKSNLDFTEARDNEWQWNPLGHMQVCTSLQTEPRQHPTTHDVRNKCIIILMLLKLHGFKWPSGLFVLRSHLCGTVLASWLFAVLSWLVRMIRQLKARVISCLQKPLALCWLACRPAARTCSLTYATLTVFAILLAVL